MPNHGFGQKSEQQDAKLLCVCARFHAIDAELDRLVACDDLPEQELMALHDQWSDALSQALILPAQTVEGQRAKAAVMKAALVVVLGIDPNDIDY